MLLAIWDDGAWQDAARVAVIITVAYVLVMWLAALIWTYRDIAARTTDLVAQIVSVLAVLVFNLPGMILYLILRPKETLADRYDRQLEAEALLHEIQDQATCSSCRRKIEDDFVACPYCRAALRVPCESCAKPLLAKWVICPYCATDRTAQALAAVTTAVAKPEKEPEGEAEPAGSGSRAPTKLRSRRPSTATYTPPASSKPTPVQADSPGDAGS